MSIRLNKALRELNIGLQTAVEFLEKRKQLGEVKAEPSFKLSDQQYKALTDAFSQDKAVRDQAEKLITKKTKDKKRAPEQQDSRAESLLESSASSSTSRWARLTWITWARNLLHSLLPISRRLLSARLLPSVKRLTR